MITEKRPSDHQQQHEPPDRPNPRVMYVDAHGGSAQNLSRIEVTVEYWNQDSMCELTGVFSVHGGSAYLRRLDGGDTIWYAVDAIVAMEKEVKDHPQVQAVESLYDRIGSVDVDPREKSN